MTTENPVEDLLIERAVRDALSRYCRAMDRRDEALAADVWHTNGSADYGDIFRGTGPEFATWVTAVHAHFERHSHQITNVLTEVIDGAHAVSEAYVTVALWTAADGSGARTQVTSRGRYLDRWELRDGRWAIAARLYVDDFTTTQALTQHECGAVSEVARRDEHDPSYALFGHLPEPA